MCVLLCEILQNIYAKFCSLVFPNQISYFALELFSVEINVYNTFTVQLKDCLGQSAHSYHCTYILAITVSDSLIKVYKCHDVLNIINILLTFSLQIANQAQTP